MVLSDEKKKEYIKRIGLSRMRILINNGFYGLLLMHMIFTLDEACGTAATDGRRMYFNPSFLDELSDSELDFVMMHEILHVALQHCFRKGDRDPEEFNIACDIVVNSNILLSQNMDRKSITLRKHGESMHIAPDGKEGYLYIAEQVFNMLNQNGKPSQSNGGNNAGNNGQNNTGNNGQSNANNSQASSPNGMPGSSNPGNNSGNNTGNNSQNNAASSQSSSPNGTPGTSNPGNNSGNNTGNNSQNNVASSQSSSPNGMPGTSNPGNNSGNNTGNNSQNNAASSQSSSPNGMPGTSNTGKNAGKNAGKNGQNNAGRSSNGSSPTTWDDHSKWELSNEDNILKDLWKKRIEQACEAVSIKDPSNKRGLLPLFAERMYKELKNPQTDWRTILNNFVQEEIVDYSFLPPDRRFGDSPFFLPDFNEKDEYVKDILFMIDTSGSMSDDMITAAYSEVKGAIDQFNGKLKGWLGFFDAKVIEPKPFEDENELKIIKPAGGGGTDFHVIFKYIRSEMQENPPASIIILTDGYAPFPEESIAENIPVLWLLNNEEVTPPWGKVARITI